MALGRVEGAAAAPRSRILRRRPRTRRRRCRGSTGPVPIIKLVAGRSRPSPSAAGELSASGVGRRREVRGDEVVEHKGVAHLPELEVEEVDRLVVAEVPEVAAAQLSTAIRSRAVRVLIDDEQRAMSPGAECWEQAVAEPPTGRHRAAVEVALGRGDLLRRVEDEHGVNHRTSSARSFSWRNGAPPRRRTAARRPAALVG